MREIIITMKTMKKIKFAVIGDCHYSKTRNYSTRDCMGAKRQLYEIIKILNHEKLDFVLSLGDIGNGDDLSEIPEMLDVFNKSVNPVKFVIGNHDLVLRTYDEVAQLVGMPAPFYDFEISQYRFVVLNAFEQSRYCPKGSPEYEFYENFRQKNDWLVVQPWPGLMTENSWQRLSALLDDAERKGQQTIIFSHVPVNEFGGPSPKRLPDFGRMLELLDKYTNVRAYIAGHCHGGGISVRNGVLHKTLRSVCDNPVPTACIFEADDEMLKIYGIGAEEDFTHNFLVKPAVISGTAPKDSIVMTNCGDVVKVGADEKYQLQVPCPGMYAIKAVKDGCNDCYIPMIKAPANNLKIEFTENKKRKLYCGYVDGFKTLQIKDGNKSVKWFDVAGNEYGSAVCDKNVLHEHCKNYWADRVYAFTAENEVSIRVIPQHKELNKEGWYKGDLHTHLVHGENIYIGNVQQSAFIGQAEGYDWLYMATDYGNDGYPTDAYTMVKKLSGEDFLYRINEEFPKSQSNHFGNCCIDPVSETIDTTKISSLELAEKYVWSRGGVTVPVHPFNEHKSFKEMCIWLLCAPEKLPCIDFFYDDDSSREKAEGYWFMLLNRGYEIGCFSTSGAAFDAGRTPASGRGATYLHMNELSEENIKNAILKGRSMVTWDCAAVVFSIGDFLSGDKIEADEKEYILKAKILWQKDRKGIIRIIRNGVDIKQIPVEFKSDDQKHMVEMTVSEKENCWYAVILESEDGKIRSAASPIYFRNNSFVPPKVIKMNKSFPPEVLAQCERLTPDELAREELIDEFAEILKKYQG